MAAPRVSTPALIGMLERAGASVLGRAPASVSFPATVAGGVLSLLEQSRLTVTDLSHTRALVHHDGETQLRLLTHATAGDAAVAVAHTALGRTGSRHAHPAGRARGLAVPLTGGSSREENELTAVLAIGYLDRQAFARRVRAQSPHEHTLTVLLLDATHIDPVTPLRDGVAYALALAASRDMIEAARLLSA